MKWWIALAVLVCALWYTLGELDGKARATCELSYTRTTCAHVMR